MYLAPEPAFVGGRPTYFKGLSTSVCASCFVSDSEGEIMRASGVNGVL